MSILVHDPKEKHWQKGHKNSYSLFYFLLFRGAIHCYKLIIALDALRRCVLRLQRVQLAHFLYLQRAKSCCPHVYNSPIGVVQPQRKKMVFTCPSIRPFPIGYRCEWSLTTGRRRHIDVIRPGAPPSSWCRKRIKTYVRLLLRLLHPYYYIYLYTFA